MKAILLGLLMFSAQNVFAETLMSSRPKECNYSRSSTEKGARTSSLTCNDFDLKYASTFANVCVFKTGSWQYGHLKYDITKKAHKFVALKVCDLGITAIPLAETLDIKSPRVGDYHEGHLDVVNYLKPSYVSLLTKSPLAIEETPILCYRGESRGVAMNAISCSREPNDSNYCEFADVGSKKYKGQWWVQYRSASKRRPVICLGGIKASNLEDAAEEYLEDQVQTSVTKRTAKELLANLPVPKVDQANDLAFEIAACLITDTKVIRVSCKNQDSAGFDVWENSRVDVEASIQKLVEFPNLIKLNLLKRAVLKAKTAVDRDAKQAELNALEAEIAVAFEARLAQFEARYGTISPINRTKEENNFCHIEWDPKDGVSRPYVFYKKSGQKSLSRVSCDSVEIVEKKKIIATTN